MYSLVTISQCFLFLVMTFAESALAEPVVTAKGRTIKYGSRVLFQRSSDLVVTLSDREIPWGVKVYLEVGFFGARKIPGQNSRDPFVWEKQEAHIMEAAGPYEWKATVTKTSYEDDADRPEGYDGVDFYFRVVHADGSERILSGASSATRYRCFFPTGGTLYSAEQIDTNREWTPMEVRFVTDHAFVDRCSISFRRQ